MSGWRRTVSIIAVLVGTHLWACGPDLAKVFKLVAEEWGLVPNVGLECHKKGKWNKGKCRRLVVAPVVGELSYAVGQRE